jgi:tetratricopeptide (TPR) repeat protein
MRTRLLCSLFLMTLAASPSFASGGGRPEAPPPSSPGSAPQSGEMKTPRQEAEGWYTNAYDDVAKAKEALSAETPDPKKAEKLFKRAIDRAGRALEYDSKYYEALNLQGFSWRKLGNYQKSLDAYAACLRIEPDYAPAREYYGEALLESGDLEGAQAQLVWLKRLRAEDLAKQLEAAIAAAPEALKNAKSSKPDAKPEGKADAKSTGTTPGGGE